MKIAITSTGPTLDDMMEARFGRCAYFLIIDLETMEFDSKSKGCESVQNTWENLKQRLEI